MRERVYQYLHRHANDGKLAKDIAKELNTSAKVISLCLNGHRRWFENRGVKRSRVVNLPGKPTCYTLEKTFKIERVVVGTVVYFFFESGETYTIQDFAIKSSMRKRLEKIQRTLVEQ